jgi:hypothetical protein
MFNVRNVNYNGYQHQVENEYYFEDGGKIVRGLYYPKGGSEGEKITVADGAVTPGGNWGSFIAACRAGDPTMANGNALDAHNGCVLGHLMNNSYRLGTNVPFNAKAGKFGDNTDAHDHFMALHEIMRDGVGDFAAEANALLKDPNRAGFEIPIASQV